MYDRTSGRRRFVVKDSEDARRGDAGCTTKQQYKTLKGDATHYSAPQGRCAVRVRHEGDAPKLLGPGRSGVGAAVGVAEEARRHASRNRRRRISDGDSRLGLGSVSAVRSPTKGPGRALSWDLEVVRRERGGKDSGRAAGTGTGTAVRVICGCAGFRDTQDCAIFNVGVERSASDRRAKRRFHGEALQIPRRGAANSTQRRCEESLSSRAVPCRYRVLVSDSQSLRACERGSSGGEVQWAYSYGEAFA